MVISNEEFNKLPKCKLCKNKGRYKKRILTQDDWDEYPGSEIGGEVDIMCGKCEAQRYRRKHLLNHPSLDVKFLFHELSDYENSSKAERKQLITERSLEVLEGVLGSLETFCETGKFLILEGPGNSGKEIISHIICREAEFLGYRSAYTDILDLLEQLSHLKSGTYLKDDINDEVLYDIDDYISPSVLVIDNFDLVNEFFRWPDIKRVNLNLILKRRFKRGFPTIILTDYDLVPVLQQEKYGNVPPKDIHRLIGKEYTRCELYGRFRQRKAKIQAVQQEAEGSSKGAARVKVRVGKPK